MLDNDIDFREGPGRRRTEKKEESSPWSLISRASAGVYYQRCRNAEGPTGR
jgi:hypothetical protein